MWCRIVLNKTINENINSEWSRLSHGALSLEYRHAAVFSAPPPWASVSVGRKQGRKYRYFLSGHHQRISLHCQRRAVSSKAKDLKTQNPINLSVYEKPWQRCSIRCWRVPLSTSHSWIFHSHRSEWALPALSACTEDGETTMQNRNG